MEEHKITEHHDLLTKLKIAVFGNGNSEMSLVSRTKKLEENFHKISTKLTVTMVLLLILIIIQAPELLVALRGI